MLHLSALRSAIRWQGGRAGDRTHDSDQPCCGGTPVQITTTCAAAAKRQQAKNTSAATHGHEGKKEFLNLCQSSDLVKRQTRPKS